MEICRKMFWWVLSGRHIIHATEAESAERDLLTRIMGSHEFVFWLAGSYFWVICNVRGMCMHKLDVIWNK